jgi:hypothetical protein
MKEDSLCDHFRITYKDRFGKDRMILYFNSAKVIQARVLLDVEDDNVKECFVAYSKTHFKSSPILFMEKEFIKNGCLINEHYVDGRLNFYFETKQTSSFDIVRGFSDPETLFHIQVKYKNSNRRPYVFYEQVNNQAGYYRRINSNGEHSKKSFDTFAECIIYQGEPLE